MNFQWFKDIVLGGEHLSSGAMIAHTVFVLAIVIAAGIALSKIKIKGVSIGVTWILFTGIAAGHFNMGFDAATLHFIKEFGLILFVFSIGLQVGPGFFSSLKRGGVTLMGLATAVIVLGALTTYVIHLVTGESLTTMVGVMSGAVTNTPGLGAAQQAYADTAGAADETISLGYAVAYPLGVVGIIFTMIALRYIFRVDYSKENEGLAAISHESSPAHRYSVEFTNRMLEGRTIAYVRELINRQFVISRIMHGDGSITMADGDSRLSSGAMIVSSSSAIPRPELATTGTIGTPIMRPSVS